jgi:hypothetical protein
MRLIWRTHPSTTVMTLNVTQLGACRRPSSANGAAEGSFVVFLARSTGLRWCPDHTRNPQAVGIGGGVMMAASSSPIAAMR